MYSKLAIRPAVAVVKVHCCPAPEPHVVLQRGDRGDDEAVEGQREPQHADHGPLTYQVVELAGPAKVVQSEAI